ncbi:MAG: GNAT family N-acetyltransferase [Ruminiclostridium sp.]|nr:GNAT family N-acetyltransferase [Ruminiclostridium sp.]
MWDILIKENILEGITNMLQLYTPKFEDMTFRQKLLSDPETMTYNQKWGGTIDFSEDMWQDWFDFWIVSHENKRFYRYLQNSQTGEFVGEIAYHLDEEREVYIADVIVLAKYRGKGFGREGLKLLCNSARENGIKILYDDIAIDNSAIALFLKNGFYEEYRTEDYIMLRKDLLK